MKSEQKKNSKQSLMEKYFPSRTEGCPLSSKGCRFCTDLKDLEKFLKQDKMYKRLSMSLKNL